MAVMAQLTVASTWDFEDTAIEDIHYRLAPTTEKVGSDCDYDLGNRAFIVKNENLKALTAKVGRFMVNFIEEHRFKDLLDMPWIRRMEPSDARDENGTEDIEVKHCQRDLLTLDGDGMSPEVKGQYEKYWFSSSGGAGCFAASHEILKEIGQLTGTKLTMESQAKGILIAGANLDDVNDAFERLKQVEKPFSLALHPCIGNIIYASRDRDSYLRLDQYESTSDVALRRILSDPHAASNAKFGQMFVTVAVCFDPVTNAFKVPENIASPRYSRPESGMSRIWSEFKFREIGNGVNYVNLEAVVETAEQKATEVPSSKAGFIGPVCDDIFADITPNGHPFLTRQKAKEVGNWVADGVRKGALLVDSEDDVPPKHDPLQGNSALELVPKKGPRVKTRMPLHVGKPLAINSSQAQSSSIVKRMPGSHGEGCEFTGLNHERNNGELVTMGIGNVSLVNNERGFSNPDHRSSLPVTPLKSVKEDILKPTSMFPSNFDVTKYGLRNASRQMSTPTKGASTRSEQTTPNSTPRRPSDILIDVGWPSTTVVPKMNQTLSFDQPALIPIASSEKDTQGSHEILRCADAGSNKRMVHEPGNLTAQTPGGNCATRSASASSHDDNISPLERRLQYIKQTIDRDPQPTYSSSSHSNTERNKLYRKRLAQLERSGESDDREGQTELATREFYRTMNHKTSIQHATAQKSVAKKANKQATLEDAWGILRVKQKPLDGDNIIVSQNKNSKEIENSSRDKHHSSLWQGEAQLQASVRALFMDLKPTLDAAQSFPGDLSLEIQIGLILLPVKPKTYDGRAISLQEWYKIFQSRNNVSVPTTKFIKRLTSSGTDINYVLDLQTHNNNRERRLFESDYSGYSVIYEYHCRTKDDRPIIIIIDEAGDVTVRDQIAVIGAVNIHFPKQVWDASAIMRGMRDQTPGSNRRLDIAIQHLVDTIWVQPDRSRIRIFCLLHENGELRVDKVFMKRWTCHKYNRPASATQTSRSTNDPVSFRGQRSGGETGSSGANRTEKLRKDISLKITEVQDLFIGTHPADKNIVRARCVQQDEMIKKGRLWYEVSIVSSAIDEILRSNLNLQAGDITEYWRSEDLLGKDAYLAVFNDASEPMKGKTGKITSSLLAEEIGNAGLGEMLRAAALIVENIDGVGYWNHGPGPEAARNTAAFEALALNDIGSTLEAPSFPTFSHKPSALPLVLPRTNKTGQSFEDLGSIKEVGGAGALNAQSGNLLEVDDPMEYW